MKVSFNQFSPNIAIKERYELGIDYLNHEFDLDFEEIMYLLINLKNHRSQLLIETNNAIIDFYIEEDNSLSVEIDHENFWSVGETNTEIGKEILRIVCEGKKFDNLIPTTDKEWGAYSGI